MVSCRHDYVLAMHSSSCSLRHHVDVSVRSIAMRVVGPVHEIMNANVLSEPKT